MKFAKQLHRSRRCWNSSRAPMKPAPPWPIGIARSLNSSLQIYRKQTKDKLFSQFSPAFTLLLRSSLMLSFPLEKPMGRTYLLWLQTLIQRFIHTNEERSTKGTLRERHPKGTRLPLPTVVSYLKQIAPALQYDHEQKLIH